MANLYESNGQNESPPNDTDRGINEYIEKYGLEYYDSVIVDDSRFPVFYNLSVLRTGLLSWYEFQGDAQVLEIGAGFGALTGLLCERCRHVTATERSLYRAQAIKRRWQARENLDVYAGEWSELSFGKKFDYIILTGILERAGGGSGGPEKYTEYLKRAAELLTADGVILLAAENRFGLKYFCGVAEPHTGRSFDGINNYPHGARGRSFSRQELTDIVKAAGFPGCRFYYPLPDYKLPQLIYSDEYLPEKNLKERLIPYYADGKHMIAAEAELYNDVVDNGVFPFFANSFLVEGAKSADRNTTTCSVAYAAVSTDRGERRSYATTVHTDHTVRKRPLFQEGMESAQDLYENTEDLRRHGIPVVDMEWEKGALRMPFVEHPTLSNYLKQLMPVNVERFQEILDELYGFILRSSEQTGSSPSGKNALADRLCAVRQEEAEKTGIRTLDWGPILKKAYMELIPLNCFYEEETRRFLFFDQEFVRENYPAKYVLFRAIHYIYCFTPGAENYLPQKLLREKYGLEEIWDYCLEEERRFLNEVRNRETYRQFYRLTKVDRAQIDKNIDRLASEEEKIANYRVSDKMKKIWKVELGILDAVEEICRKHEIRYFAIHGTLLGAVRHKGFIPWDDDLDIGMLREDYDRFVEAARKELRPPYALQNMWEEKDCFFGGFCRIRNSDTTGIQAKDLGHEGNQGIWIDILPFDVCTENEKKLERKIRKIRRRYFLLSASVYGKDQKRYADLNALQWKLYRLAAVFFPHTLLCRLLDDAMRLYTEETSEGLAAFTGYGKPRILNRSDFETTTFLDFERRRLPVPTGYENYLFMTMGKDYMKYPPEEERKPKHRGIFDPDRPYADYVKKLTGMFDGVKGKKIILFGAGLMFDDYMKKWGSRYRPAFIVDNDKSKWGRTRQGIEIREPAAILKIPANKRRLILCSYYYKEIEKQLQELGITDYQVYVQHLEWILQSEGRDA